MAGVRAVRCCWPVKPDRRQRQLALHDRRRVGRGLCTAMAVSALWQADGERKTAMKNWITAAALALAALAAHAQAYEGEVRKIEKAQGKITLRHGELKGLDMPPMTMVYRVSNPAILDSVAVGDKVKFDATKVGGNYTVTAISKAQ
jgi:Cu(I)/Ag(I) efflux system protein CusF